MLKLNGREVVNVEIDGVDTRDYPDFCDVYFSYGVFADTGEELTDKELDDLLESNSEMAYEMAFESCL